MIQIAAGAGLALLIGGVFLVMYLVGGGSVVVFAPEGDTVTVFDGDQSLGEVTGGSSKTFSLAQGKHSVRVVSRRSGEKVHQLDVSSGLYRQGVPVAGQCLAVFDVTDYWYSPKKKSLFSSKTVKVDAKFLDGAPFDVPSANHSTEELPSKIKDKERARVLLTVDCEAAKQGDAELILRTFGGGAS
jgi:hypothetical protein